MKTYLLKNREGELFFYQTEKDLPKFKGIISAIGFGGESYNVVKELQQLVNTAHLNNLEIAKNNVTIPKGYSNLIVDDVNNFGYFTGSIVDDINREKLTFYCSGDARKKYIFNLVEQYSHKDTSVSYYVFKICLALRIMKL